MKVVCKDGELSIDMKDFRGMGSDWVQCVQTGKEREYVEGLVSRARAAQLARPQQLTNRAVGAPSSRPHPRPVLIKRPVLGKRPAEDPNQTPSNQIVFSPNKKAIAPQLCVICNNCL